MKCKILRNIAREPLLTEGSEHDLPRPQAEDLISRDLAIPLESALVVIAAIPVEPEIAAPSPSSVMAEPKKEKPATKAAEQLSKPSTAKK